MEKCRKTHVLPEVGTRLRTKKRIAPMEACRGFFVKERHLEARKPNCEGKYTGYVAGAGGDVWWIEHLDGTIGAYAYNELTDV